MCIYIAEGDREYQYNLQGESDIKEKIWQQFSTLAKAQDRLIQELQLSSREAKKLVQKREAMEFTSLADIESIEGLAKISLKKIKDYLAHQQCNQIELFGVQSASSPHPKDTKKSSRPSKRSRKKHNSDTETKADPLFPLKELVS